MARIGLSSMAAWGRVIMHRRRVGAGAQQDSRRLHDVLLVDADVRLGVDPETQVLATRSIRVSSPAKSALSPEPVT